jgi:hypothetical protein
MSDTWRIGDRVEVGSVWAVRPARNRKGRRATGHITGFNSFGIEVHFDHAPISGCDWCTASPDELTRIEDFA